MGRSLEIQTFGAVAVLAAFIGAELAAWYLVACPSCELAWYLNLGPFHIFETARNSTAAIRYLFSPLSLPMALLMLIGLLIARHRRMRLLIAIGANLSFAFVVALIDAEMQARSIPDTVMGASSISVLVQRDFTVWLIVILSVSGLSCLASHASFFLAIRSEVILRRPSPAATIRTAPISSAMTATA